MSIQARSFDKNSDNVHKRWQISYKTLSLVSIGYF